MNICLLRNRLKRSREEVYNPKAKWVVDLSFRLKKSLQDLGIQHDFEMVLRPYSKTFFGRYESSNNRMILYLFKDPELRKLYSYKQLLRTAIHEACHLIQWKDPNHVRKKGIMHDVKFYQLEKYYVVKADKIGGAEDD